MAKQPETSLRRGKISDDKPYELGGKNASCRNNTDIHPWVVSTQYIMKENIFQLPVSLLYSFPVTVVSQASELYLQYLQSSFLSVNFAS